MPQKSLAQQSTLNRSTQQKSTQQQQSTKKKPAAKPTQKKLPPRPTLPGQTPTVRPPTAMPFANATTPPPGAWSDVRLRLVRRATMGLRAQDADEVRAKGYQQYLNDQVYYTRIDDTALEADVATRYPLLALPAASMAIADQGALQSQLQEATIYRAAFSRRQLYERMVEFWSDHFNVAITKVGYLKAVEDREVIRRHALGKFRDLLTASAHSPAMLAYLDQNLSRAGAPNQNYARELMELHTLGVDGGYTQTDVDELARVFTGWSFTGAGAFVFNPNRHDWNAKTVLGVTIPAAPPSTGAAGVAEGQQMLNVLIDHPSTARFLATKMLKWLLTPEPTSTQINAIASVYRATRGDIKLMVRAILNESWMSVAPSKFKRPFHYLVASLRATNPAITTLNGVNGQLRTLGQQLFFYETPDGYPDTVEFWAGNIQPRWNFANYLAGQASPTVVNVDVTPYLAGTAAAAIDKIEDDFFASELAVSTRLALLTYLNGGTFNATRVRETIALALSTADFQWC